MTAEMAVQPKTKLAVGVADKKKILKLLRPLVPLLRLTTNY